MSVVSLAHVSMQRDEVRAHSKIYHACASLSFMEINEETKARGEGIKSCSFLFNNIITNVTVL